MDGILSQYRKQCFGTNKIFICVGQLKNQLLQKNSIFCWYVESSSKLDFSPELAFLMGGEGGKRTAPSCKNVISWMSGQGVRGTNSLVSPNNDNPMKEFKSLYT